jgi:hypothetical protein
VLGLELPPQPAATSVERETAANILGCIEAPP